MKLYHGSNTDINVINLALGLRHKDFGKGFYATPDRMTAIRMAQKKARLFGGQPTLITYEFDESALHSNLKIKIFPEKACVEWLLFVDANRDRKNLTTLHDYDIVIGPVANDQTILTINLYLEGLLGKEAAIAELLPQRLSDQYTFRTDRAIALLQFQEALHE